jgi:hypothetical protein
MNKYTVIGYYAEDNQTTADPAEADNGLDAMRIVARERLGERDAAGDYENQGDFQLVVAVQDGDESKIESGVVGEPAKPGDRFTWPGDGMVEAREFIEPGWGLANAN